jgi:enoyl-CoA hydratase
MALACDLIVASREAKFGLPEVKRGLAATAGGLMRLPRRIPYYIAMQYALTGALDRALSVAFVLLAKGLLAVAASNRVVAELRGWPNSEMFERQPVYTRSVFDSEDAKGGARVFAEKRAPEWRGR